MAVSKNDVITAATFNTLQSRIANVLGNGFAASGYGQSLASSTVSATSVVTATHLEALRTDINKARVHQTGSLTSLQEIVTKNIIGADASGSGITFSYTPGSNPPSTEYYTTSINDPNSYKGVNDYLNAVDSLEADQYLCDDTQASVEAAISSTRTIQWNGTIIHTFTASFTSADARRHFFNSGGQIRFQAQLSNGSGAKDSDWATMLSNMGTIIFDYNTTTATGSGTPSAIGNYDLTTSYQTVYTKGGSGVYAENSYVIKAKAPSATQIEFRVEFQDNDVGEGLNPPGYVPIDENVIAISGTMTSTITQRRATGSYVSVPSPSYTNTSTL